jgi:hypothetical protein
MTIAASGCNYSLLSCYEFYIQGLPLKPVSKHFPNALHAPSWLVWVLLFELLQRLVSI